jgi:hypothetical protein
MRMHVEKHASDRTASVLCVRRLALERLLLEREVAAYATITGTVTSAAQTLGRGCRRSNQSDKAILGTVYENANKKLASNEDDHHA